MAQGDEGSPRSGEEDKHYIQAWKFHTSRFVQEKEEAEGRLLKMMGFLPLPKYVRLQREFVPCWAVDNARRK